MGKRSRVGENFPQPINRRCVLSGNVEFFCLPGYEKDDSRFLLSLTNAAEVVCNNATSIFDFLKSNAFKAILGKAPEFSSFSVKNAQKPIAGIPLSIAQEYWLDQLSKGNQLAKAIVRKAISTSCSQESKRKPLPRRVIPLATGIEVFGLPGFDRERGRYLLSQTNAAEAVGKTNTSIIDEWHSNAFKSLLGARPELSTFVVEGAQKPIVGIPTEIAYEYWLDQLSKGNQLALAIAPVAKYNSPLSKARSDDPVD